MQGAKNSLVMVSQVRGRCRDSFPSEQDLHFKARANIHKNGVTELSHYLWIVLFK